MLTAHPTEAKRRTVLDHHRALYRLLVEMENTMWTGTERAAFERLQARTPDLFAALVAAKAEESRWPPVHFLASNAATARARASTVRVADRLRRARARPGPGRALSGSRAD